MNKPLCASFIIAAFIVAGVAANPKQPRYHISDLGLIDNPRINDSGTIVGSLGQDAIALTSDGIVHLWTGRANDINNRGDIVGTSNGQAVVWSEGLIRTLGDGAGNAINDLGQVAGSSFLGATLWDVDGSVHELPDPDDPHPAAFGINNQGHVVGVSFFDSQYRAVEWTNGAIHVLPTLCGPGQCASFASAINSNEQITGQSDHNAVIWSNGVLHDLGTLGGPASGSTGIDINDAGWVVGDAPGFGTAPTVAFVFDGARMYDLNTLVIGKKEFSILTVGHGINNEGQIVGQGFKGGSVHAFLATPATPAKPAKRQR